MRLITSNDQLRRHVPNTFAPVTGETPLYDKMETRLRAAELWFTQRVTDLRGLYREEDNTLVPLFPIPEDLVPGIIVTEAFRHSIDSLNLVLTANGFGIVSNDHIAPASKERTDRLKEELRVQRDAQLSRFLTCMEGTDWTACSGWRKFHETLVHFDSSYIDPVRFEDWEAGQGMFRIIEDSLADRYISRPLYDTLRSTHIHTDSHLRPLHLALIIIERNILKGQDQHRQLRALVDVIRTATEADGVTPARVFDCWRDSPTAILWQDHSFQNDPKRGGIWI